MHMLFVDFYVIYTFVGYASDVSSRV